MRVPRSMHAAVLLGPGRMATREVETPHLNGGLLLRVLACGVCGSDRRQFQGPAGRGQIIGHEVVGEVVRASAACRRYAGRRVVVAPRIACRKCRTCERGYPNLCPDVKVVGYQIPGGYADFIQLPREAALNGNVIELPDGLPDATAALAEPVSCVINGIDLSRPQRGSKVLIFGAGPMGQMFLQMVRGEGRRICVVEPDHLRGQFALAHGADAVLPPDSPDIPEAEVVIVACSSPLAYRKALERAAPGATVNLFGGLADGISIDSNVIHYRQLRVHGTSGSTPAQVAEAVEVLSTRPSMAEIVTGVVGLGDLPGILSGKEGGGLELKMVLDPRR